MKNYAIVIFKLDEIGGRPLPEVEEFEMDGSSIDISRYDRRHHVERIVGIDMGGYLEELFGLDEAAATIRDLARKIMVQYGVSRVSADKLVTALAPAGCDMYEIVNILSQVCRGLGYPAASQFRITGVEGEVYGKLVAAMKMADAGVGADIRTRSGDVARFELGSNDPNRLVFSVVGQQMDVMDILLWMRKEYPELVEEILGVKFPK